MKAHAAAPVDGNLPAAKRLLADAISTLIDPRPHVLDGKTHWLDSRYSELRQALDSQRIGASHQPASKPPAWLDALDLLAAIDHTARRLSPDWHATDDTDVWPTVQRLTMLDRRRWRPQDADHVADTANMLISYAKRVDALFAPHPKYLPDRCPRCGAAHTTRNVAGETIRTPALAITDDGATCGCCHAHWEPARLLFLGRILGYRVEGLCE